MTFVGRGERIRTSDLSVPNRAHYQAVLRPESWRILRVAGSRVKLWLSPSYNDGLLKDQKLAAVIRNSRVLSSARARWLIRFLIVSVSSANVSAKPSGTN